MLILFVFENLSEIVVGELSDLRIILKFMKQVKSAASGIDEKFEP